jgi:voltage-gated sodium channel
MKLLSPEKKEKVLDLLDKFILGVILVNSCIIYAQVSGTTAAWVSVLDIICTTIFIAEMLFKLKVHGWREYWADGWNKLDGILVIISLPSLIEPLMPVGALNVSFLLILRLLRVLRFFRVLHFFPNFDKVVKGFKTAVKQSYAILLSFLIIIIVFGLINCSLFKDADPEHFQTPLRSIYAVFQICTVEGWYEIPNAVVQYYGTSSIVAEFIRLYFCFILLLGGIVGMSFINSIFVDAMVSDNNNDLEQKVDELNAKLDKLLGEKKE